MLSMTQFDRKSLTQDLIVRGWKDPAFRELLDHDPKAAIEEHLGHALPDEMSVVTHTEDVNSIHLVMPYLPKESPQVENQLEWLLDSDRLEESDTDEGCSDPQDSYCTGCEGSTHDGTHTCTKVDCPALRHETEYESVI